MKIQGIMISKDEIKRLLRDIENERVERTTSTSDTAKFAKTVCAFANDLSNKKQPGYLMVGVKDDGSLNGLKVTDELLRNLAGLRADGNIQPKPALMVEKVSFPAGDIAVVEVQPGTITPVKYKGVTYVRIGARKSEANEEEERILREKSEVKSRSFDSTPCQQSTIDDLDLALFKKEYLPMAIDGKVLNGDKREVKQQLASLKLFDIVQDRPTVAGVLLVGKEPARILFGAYVQYVKFEGQRRTTRILNERRFSGNLITMLRELDYFIKYTIQMRRPVFVTVLREEMRINYPYEAIRELAINLVMHRNYETNAPARIYEYSDRIEMDNPGNLYGRVHPDNFPNENDYRNPVIADAMKTLGYANQFSRGINMVQEQLEENNNGLAVFDFRDITTFKVTVANADLKFDEGEVKGEAESEVKDEVKGEVENEAINEAINLGSEIEKVESEAENEVEDEVEDEAINGAENEVDEAEKVGGEIEKVGSEVENEAEKVGGEVEKVESEAENEAEKVGGEIEKVESEAENEAEKVGNEAEKVEGEAENEAEKITPRQTRILELIQVDNNLSRGSISKQLKISVSSVYRDIEKLKKIGKLERLGGDKGGCWKIK